MLCRLCALRGEKNRLAIPESLLYHVLESRVMKADSSSDNPVSKAGVVADEVVRKIEALGQVCEFRTPDAVREYLRKRPVLLDLLGDIPSRAVKYFGDDSRIVLDVRPDREGSGPSELFAYVVTELSPGEARARMASLERAWWFEAAGDEPVNLHVEFV